MDEKLPNEILIKILEYLPPPSLLVAATVSPHWSHLVQTFGVCRFDFSVLDDHHHQHLKRTAALIRNQIPTKSDGARVRYILVMSDRLVSNKVFLFIQRLCPNVILFDYDYDLLDTTATDQDMWRHPFLPNDGGDGGGWQRTITHLPACMDDQSERMSWSSANVDHQRLESLYVRRSHTFLLNMPFLPYLDALGLHTTHDRPLTLYEKSFDTLHRQCPRLTSLTIHGMSLNCFFARPCYPNPDIISDVVPKLNVLKLENVTFLNQESFHYFPSKYPNVHTLVLSTDYNKNPDRDFVGLNRWRHGDPECIYNMITRFKHLKRLKVHVQGSDTKGHLHSKWLQRQIQTHCSPPSVLNEQEQPSIHLEITIA